MAAAVEKIVAMAAAVNNCSNDSCYSYCSCIWDVGCCRVAGVAVASISATRTSATPYAEVGGEAA